MDKNISSKALTGLRAFERSTFHFSISEGFTKASALKESRVMQKCKKLLEVEKGVAHLWAVNEFIDAT